MNSVLKFHNHLPLLPAPPTTAHHDGASTSTSTSTSTSISAAKRPRKKRLNSKKQLQNGVVSVSATADNNIARACSECGKKFISWKALFGHMRCHPERQWRGINPPPKHCRPASPVLTTTTRPLNDNLDDFEVASCLLLLANNGSDTTTAATTADNTIIHDHHQTNYEDVEANNNDTTTTTFECSSCKKVFRSHQALGGHRASHKNVKGCFAMARSSRSTSGGDHHDHHDAVGTCCRINNSTFGLDFDLNLPAVREDNGGYSLVSSSCSSSHHPVQLANLDLRLGL